MQTTQISYFTLYLVVLRAVTSYTPTAVRSSEGTSLLNAGVHLQVLCVCVCVCVCVLQQLNSGFCVCVCVLQQLNSGLCVCVCVCVCFATAQLWFTPSQC